MKESDAKQFAIRVAKAIERVARDLADGDVEDEEPFSDQLCGRVKETLQDFKTETLVWQTKAAGFGAGRLQARTLKKTTEEPTFGADIVIVLDLESVDYAVQKGYFVQAKRLEKGKSLSPKEFRRLCKQCEDMLSFTSSSFVFLYGAHGVHVVSANSVVSIKNQNIWTLPSYSIETLFYDFAICWIGDQRIHSTSKLSLQGLVQLVGARAAIRFIGRGIA